MSKLIDKWLRYLQYVCTTCIQFGPNQYISLKTQFKEFPSVINQSLISLVPFLPHHIYALLFSDMIYLGKIWGNDLYNYISEENGSYIYAEMLTFWFGSFPVGTNASKELLYLAKIDCNPLILCWRVQVSFSIFEQVIY